MARNTEDVSTMTRLKTALVWHALLAGLVVAGGGTAFVPALAAPLTSQDQLFTPERDVPLGPKIDRFDYQSLDPSTGRLFISGMSIGKLLIFDTSANKLLAELDGYPKVTGVLAVPELHKVYASVPGEGVGALVSVASGMAGLGNGRGQVVILDSRTLREIARVPGGVFPNGITYDPEDRAIFVTDEFGKGVSIIDGEADRTIGRVELGGLIGNVQYDPITKRVYAAVKDTNELVAIDPKSHAVVARYRLKGGRHPHGVAIAPELPVGFVACDEDDRLLVVALDTGRVLNNLPIAHRPDVLAIDPALRRLYIASESGALSVLDIKDAASPAVIATFPFAENAHSVGVDPNSHRIFLPLRNVDGRAVLRILQPKT
jgi:DNA-binding beta-propeller fold protein YncE